MRNYIRNKLDMYHPAEDQLPPEDMIIEPKKPKGPLPFMVLGAVLGAIIGTIYQIIR